MSVTSLVEFLRMAAFALFILFGVLYQVRSHGAWRRGPEGMWLMALVFVIVEFLGLAVAAQTFGPGYWGQRGFQVWVFSNLTALPAALIVMLIRAPARLRRLRDREQRRHDDVEGT